MNFLQKNQLCKSEIPIQGVHLQRFSIIYFQIQQT